MVAAAVIGSAVVGAVASSSASSRAAGAQNRATDAASAAASDQTALSREQFDWNKQNYNDNILPAQQRAEAINTRIADEGLAASQQQRQFSSEQNQYYKSTFQPLEQQMVRDAQNYDSAENIARRSGIAAANVNQQFSNAEAQRARLAGRYGLSSSTFANQAAGDSRAQALASAGAQTGAAFDTMDKAIALRAGAANFGRNMPNTAVSFGQLGNQSSAYASGAAGASMNSAIAGGNYMNNAYNTRFSNIGSTNGLFTNAMNNSANYFGNQSAGWGNFAGGMFQRGVSSGAFNDLFGSSPSAIGYGSAGSAAATSMVSDGSGGFVGVI